MLNVSSIDCADCEESCAFFILKKLLNVLHVQALLKGLSFTLGINYDHWERKTSPITSITLYCGLGGPNSRTCIQLFVSQQQLRSLHDLIRNLRTTTLGKNTQI